MITRSIASVDSLTWQEQLAESIRDPKKLLEWLEFDQKIIDSLLGGATEASNDFSLRAPKAYLKRITKGDPNDPLLKQILPSKEEMYAIPGYTTDPLEETEANLVPGLIHKYPGRVLLVVSTNCAINCRYCFRRSFPYQENKPGRGEWEQALAYIRNNTSITEVIFSGGDPLAASDKQLRWLTNEISKIPHIQRLRVHTRLPIVIPDRITDDCIEWLTSSRLLTSLVIHSNHPKELDVSVAAALNRLSQAGVILLNQTVLLAGINDSIEVLQELSERLFQMKVLPYYLHQLDKVKGAAHFEVNDATAKALILKLTSRLPGYLVPKLVREIPGMPSKVPLL
ncbi:MAG: EF-P beta-lysylation protein EpmB [Porticoccus sp.]|nr:EF-P beta-lysylation protein EpmB [Porticoccus sp.]